MTNQKRTRSAGVRVVAVLAVAALALGFFPLAGMAGGQDQSVGAYDAYLKVTVDHYQCGTIEDPDTGATQFAIYGTGGAEWSFPNDTSITTRLELLSPYAFVYFEDFFGGFFGGDADSGSLSGVDAAFPVDPEGYPVILKFTSTTSVGDVPTYRQTLTLTCAADGLATPTETEESLVAPASPVLQFGPSTGWPQAVAEAPAQPAPAPAPATPGYPAPAQPVVAVPNQTG
jgi:hypothetical protein